MNSFLVRKTAAALLVFLLSALPLPTASAESPHLYRLTEEWKGGPGLLATLKSQAGIARQQAFLASGSLWGSRARGPLQITLNVLTGEKSEDFDDAFPNPGDGYGLENHVSDAVKEAALAARDESLDKESKLHADRLLRALENMQEHVARAVEFSRAGIEAAEDQQVLRKAGSTRDELYFAEAGFDKDRSGEVDPEEWALGRAIEEAELVDP